MRRDCFLAAETHGDYLPPPVDLALLSGGAAAFAETSVLDAVAERLSPKTSLARAAGKKPDAVVFLTSGRTYDEDSRFLTGLREKLPKARFIGLGDMYRDVGALAFSLQPFLDAVITDLSAADLRSFLERRGDGPLEGFLFRGAERLVSPPHRRHFGTWSPKAPAWNLFPLGRYALPLAPGGPAAALVSDFGCPYPCGYCPVSAMGHRLRPIEDVLEEARTLRALGVKAVLIADQTFGAHSTRTMTLLDGLARQGPGFSWAAWTRVDLAQENLLSAMKRAGAGAVGFGIDSGDDEVLRASKKTTTAAQARSAVAAARKAGLKVWGSFVLGLPVDTRETVEKSLAFARSLKLDRVDYRVDSARKSVSYRRELLVKGLVPPESMPPDTPTSTSVWQGRLGISNADVAQYHEEAAA